MGNKLEQAKRVIEELFGDTSVSADETLAHLEELRDELEIKIDALYNQVNQGAVDLFSSKERE